MERDEAPSNDHSDYYGSVEESELEEQTARVWINQVNQMNQINQSENSLNQKTRLDEALEGLICAIHESPEYKEYQDIRARVHELPELEQRIHAFRRKNYETQNSIDEWDLYERVDGLEREGAEFRKDPLVNEYLDAELAFCRLFQKMNWEIVRNIDFDLGFEIDR